jgi:hypothetical protein
MMGQQGPKVPGPTLIDFGKGRFLGRRPARLERYDAGMWRQVGVFGDAREAGIALDEAIGSGADPSTLRVIEVGPSPTARVVYIVAAALLVAFAAFALYVVFA